MCEVTKHTNYENVKEELQSRLLRSETGAACR